MEAIMEHFITRKGDKLFNGDEEFRFVSINIPNLHINEDPLPNWHRIDQWEVEDAFKTINLMGGQVTRMYTFSIKGGIRPGEDGTVHVYGPRKFDEGLFQDLDKVIELAHKHNIRLIIPFIDFWDWFGGVKHFAALRGKTASDFWTDREIVEDFKSLINFVINRTNSYSGVPYKEEKAIMAWETGNELDDCTDAWTEEIAEYIRSLDQNHLIIDGKYGISDTSLDNPNIDIVSNHYYVDRGQDIIGRVLDDIQRSKGKKPFIIGEFNHKDSNIVKKVMKTAIDEGAAGALLWSLRYHSKDGGFYYHGQPNDPNNPCFNWPGFPSRGATGEREKLHYLQKSAYQIRGCLVPEITAPEAPILLSITTPEEIKWRGSAGAEYYILERAQQPNGPWKVISDNIIEDSIPFVPFKDGPTSEGNYFYRMRACNQAGISAPSNVESVVIKSVIKN
jgi:Cellulase (glycosyl hydrolase family 5)